MPISILPSLRNFASKKPWNNGLGIATSTGAQSYYSVAPPLGVTYEITYATAYNYHGTATGEWQFRIYDGSNIRVINDDLAASANADLIYSGSMGYEAPFYFGFLYNMSVAGNIFLSWGGWQYISGEGDLD